MEEYYDLVQHIKSSVITFKLAPQIWKKYDKNFSDLNSYKWREIKFLNDDGTDMNEDMNSLPSDKGGLYFFYIKSGIIPNNGYLAYIGRAHITSSQNLKKRCRSYYQTFNNVNKNDRPKIEWLIKNWGAYLFIKYIELDNNDEIDELEKRLINSILPPFNSEIPDKQIKRAVAAF